MICVELPPTEITWQTSEHLCVSQLEKTGMGIVLFYHKVNIWEEK